MALLLNQLVLQIFMMNESSDSSLDGYHFAEKTWNLTVVNILFPLEILFESVQNIVSLDYLGSFFVLNQKQLTLY